MRNYLVTSLIIVAALAGCGKQDASQESAAASASASATSASAATASAAGASKPASVRQATYDPNLRPTNIVWDNPEKQRQWEARQKAAGQPVGTSAQQTASPAQKPASGPVVVRR